MRLHRLVLEHWKGVDHRELEFGDGVTLVEGPNESGKSTLLEALTLLLEEYDSSGKQSVRAVQPAGEDVGSSVTAELQTGPYRFVYSKTFNRHKRTELQLSAPDRQRLTGREAHEAVQRMLAETVDLDLWRTLLVLQGEGWNEADLKQSRALARALDASAGAAASAPAGEAAEESLYEAVATEYGRYFTEKQGRPRFNDLIDACDQAGRALQDAEDALAEVAGDSEAHERQQREVARLEDQLPGLQQARSELEAAWRQARQLDEQAAAGRRDLATAQKLLGDVQTRLEERRQLLAELEERLQECATAEAELEPLRESQQARYAARDDARSRRDHARQSQRQARKALQQATADAQEWQRRTTIETLTARLSRIEAIVEARRQEQERVTANAVDDDILAAYRAADTELTRAEQRRDAASPRVVLEARQELMVSLDGDSHKLAPASPMERLVQAPLRLDLPDTLTVRIEPSYSATELQGAVEEAAQTLAVLASRHGPGDLDGAIAASTRRAAAAQRLAQLEAELAGLLKDESQAALGERLAECRSTSARYCEQRGELPASEAAAGAAVTAARQQLDRAEGDQEAAEEAFDRSASDCESGERQLQEAQQRLVALRAAVDERQTALARARAALSDEELAAQYEARRRDCDRRQADLDRLEAARQAAAPDRAQLLFDNAKAACDRSERDLADARNRLAVLTDRLSRARADGRYEAREDAERRSLALQDELASTQQRARAAARLYETLSRHRDAARRAYAQPLTEAIDRLGRLVFGPDFAVTLAEDWSVASRTLDGLTLPFDALSLGAREQLGILSRLAAAELVARDQGVPLIIDDALGYSDPARLQTMGAAIAAVGRTCQIIVLTCTPGRYSHVGNARTISFESC